ncbi:ABC transporter substrate-binding protein [bacterium]|nr:ABC transporter substrate-binding protein [candidate division CSSED10-310 bacterium]
MKISIKLFLMAFVICMPFIIEAQTFKSEVGDIPVGNVAGTSLLEVPYITWGGDMATFYANGGLTTQPGTIFARQGLNIKLVAGDNFIQQVRNYRSGKTPFLRGTFRMMGMASEVLASDPRTQGMVIMQMTWSAGDHLVVRKNVKDAKDLKGKTIALQKGGPHIGMLDDILATAKLDWNDIKVVWADDLTASPKSPPEMCRNNPQIDGCFVITPDMIGLCGGLHNVGSGAEGTVKGSRVLVSTADLSRSIADVYVCRKDFFDANKDLVTRFVAGYLKACEEVVALKNQYESKGSKDYMQLLQMTQNIYGKETIPTLEEDAHGLLTDCTFVGHPGNIAFFQQKNNLNGFDYFLKSSQKLSLSQGFATKKTDLLPSAVDFNSKAFIGYLTRTEVEQGERFRGEAVVKEIEELSRGGGLDDRTIVSFTINFDPNQTDFSRSEYNEDYQRVVEMADKYGNAAIAIRGHADPTKTLLDLVRAGMEKGVLQRSGSAGNYRYSLKGKPLNLDNVQDISRLIEAGEFDGARDSNPRETMQAALNLSRKRAEKVRDSIIAYAKSKGLVLDTSQIQAVGVGIREPFIAKPANMDEARQNMRVEFRLLRITAEALKQSDFDF